MICDDTTARGLAVERPCCFDGAECGDLLLCFMVGACDSAAEAKRRREYIVTAAVPAERTET